MLNLYYLQTHYTVFKDPYVLLSVVPPSLSILPLLSELSLLESKREEKANGRKTNRSL